MTAEKWTERILSKCEHVSSGAACRRCVIGMVCELLDLAVPEWARWPKVWTEDDATTSDPDHETVDEAWEERYGSRPDRSQSILTYDGGDCECHLMPGERVLVASYPGGSEILERPASSGKPTLADRAAALERELAALRADEATDLERRLAAVYLGRRGKMHDAESGWCAGCGRRLVNAAAGYDTCDHCLERG